MRFGVDLDGTLLDSRFRHVAAVRQAAAALETPLSEATAWAYLRIKQDGATGRDALRQLGVAAADQIAALWVRIIEHEDLLGLDRLYPDTVSALERQRTRGDAFVLVTARQDPEAARRQVAALGLGALVDAMIVVDPADGTQTKGAVTHGQDLAAIIGDTEVDQQWAEDLGVSFHASAFGFRSPAFWRARSVVGYDSLSAILATIEAGRG